MNEISNTYWLGFPTMEEMKAAVNSPHALVEIWGIAVSIKRMAKDLDNSELLESACDIINLCEQAGIE